MLAVQTHTSLVIHIVVGQIMDILYEVNGTIIENLLWGDQICVFDVVYSREEK